MMYFNDVTALANKQNNKEDECRDSEEEWEERGLTLRWRHREEGNAETGVISCPHVTCCRECKESYRLRFTEVLNL